MSDHSQVPFMPSREAWERASASLAVIERILAGAGFKRQNSAERLEDVCARMADQYLVGLSRIAGQITPQRIVYSHVAQRGYAEGWTPAQFAARQLVKLVEEVAELAAYINLPTDTDSGLGLYLNLQEAGAKARKLFDSPGQEQWAGAHIFPQAADEAADVQVVLYCLSEAIGMDVQYKAIQNSADDRRRGVR